MEEEKNLDNNKIQEETPENTSTEEHEKLDSDIKTETPIEEKAEETTPEENSIENNTKEETIIEEKKEEINNQLNQEPVANNNKAPKKNNKLITIIIAIVVFLVIIYLIAFIALKSLAPNINKGIPSFFNIFNKAKEKLDENENKIFDDALNTYKDAVNGVENNDSNNTAEEIIDKFTNIIDKASYNFELESYKGTQDGEDIKELIDTITELIEKYESHPITIIYNDINTTNKDEINNLKSQFDNEKEYNVSFNYDENGYISQITITE